MTPYWYRWNKETDTITGCDKFEPDIFATENRRVAETFIETALGKIRVSTVFLCLDHGYSSSNPDMKPILFETMVFGGHYDQYQDRYHTSAEARFGHEQICKMVRRMGFLNVAWFAKQQLATKIRKKQKTAS